MGVPIIDTLSTTGAGGYPLVNDADVKGSLRSVANQSARLAIPVALLNAGALVYQIDAALFYKFLGGNPSLSGSWTTAVLTTSQVATLDGAIAGINDTLTGLQGWVTTAQGTADDARGAADAATARLDAYDAALGQPGGVATLGGDGKLNASQIPDSVLSPFEYKSTWNAATNTPPLPAASPANKGFVYKVAVAGNTTIDGQNDWDVGDYVISNGTTWDKIDNTEKLVTLGTANGLTIGGASGQVLSLSLASGSAPGAMSAAHFSLLANASANVSNNTLVLRDGTGTSNFFNLGVSGTASIGAIVGVETLRLDANVDSVIDLRYSSDEGSSGWMMRFHDSFANADTLTFTGNGITATGTIQAATLTGSINGSNLVAGSVAVGKLSTTGTASSSTYLRGDGVWAAVSGGGGTVTSVGLTAPAIFTVSNSPVVTSGTLALSLNSQTANLFLASPDGGSGVPAFRAIAAADLPATVPAWAVVTPNGGSGTGLKLVPGASSTGPLLDIRNAADTSSVGKIDASGIPYFPSIRSTGATLSIYPNTSGASGSGTLLFQGGSHTFTGSGDFKIPLINATSTDGVIIETGSVASSGNPQWSPRLRISGAGFCTSVPLAVTSDVKMEVRPVSDTDFNTAVGSFVMSMGTFGTYTDFLAYNYAAAKTSFTGDVAVSGGVSAAGVVKSFGLDSQGTSATSFVAGAGAVSQGTNSTVIGVNSSQTTNNDNCTLVGYGISTSARMATAVGAGAKHLSNFSTLIGVQADGGNQSGVVVIGQEAAASHTKATIFGYKARSFRANSVCFDSNEIGTPGGTVFDIGGSTNAAKRQMFSIDATWIDSSDATRKGRAVFYAYDTAAREFMRADATGSGVQLAFGGSVVSGADCTTYQSATTSVAELYQGIASGTGTILKMIQGASATGKFIDLRNSSDSASLFSVAGTGATTVSVSGIGNTNTNGLLLTNTTAAAVGAPQYSPSLALHGDGWDTTNSQRKSVDLFLEAVPVSGTATSVLAVGRLRQTVTPATVGSANTVNVLTWDQNGNVNVGGNLNIVNGNIGAVGTIATFGAVTAAISTTTTSVDGFNAITDSLASVGSPNRWSPRARCRANVYNGSTGIYVDHWCEVKTNNSGSASYSGEMVWSYSDNGGSAVELFGLDGRTKVARFTGPVTVTNGGSATNTLTLNTASSSSGTAIKVVPGTSATGKFIDLRNSSDSASLFSVDSGGAVVAKKINVAVTAPASVTTSGQTVTVVPSNGGAYDITANQTFTLGTPGAGTNHDKITLCIYNNGGSDFTPTFTTGSTGAYALGDDITSVTCKAGKLTYVGITYSTLNNRWNVLAAPGGY